MFLRFKEDSDSSSDLAGRLLSALSATQSQTPAHLPSETPSPELPGAGENKPQSPTAAESVQFESI